MKRGLLVITVLLTLVAVVVYYQLYRKHESIHPSFFLPENVLIYIQQKDLASITVDPDHNPLFETFRSIDIVRLALDVEVPVATVEKIRSFYVFLRSPEARIIFDEFFSKYFAVALLPHNSLVEERRNIHGNMIIFSEPRHGNALLETVTSLTSADIHISSIQYGSHLIYRIPLGEEISLSIVSTGRLVVASLQEKTLRQALDRYDDQKINLRENFFYSELSKKHKQSQLFCYFSIAGIKQQLQTLLHEEIDWHKQILEHLEKWNGFTSAGYGAERKKGYSHNVITFHFNKYKLNKRTAALFSTKPEYNHTIVEAPAGTLLYYWTNTLDIAALWNMFMKETGSTGVSAEIEENVAVAADISFNDLLGLVGNSFHVMVSRPATVDLIPVPNFTLKVSIRDDDKAITAFYNIFKKSLIPHKNEIYRGILFTYWGKEMQKGLQPVFTFYNNTLYISSSIKKQQEIIDTIMDGNSIVESNQFKQHGKDLLLPSNSMVFAQVPDLLETAEMLVRWSGTIMALQDRKTAYMSKKVIDDLILPLLVGLKHHYSGVTSRSYFEESKFSIESQLIPTQPN